jgi:hypothetical protein
MTSRPVFTTAAGHRHLGRRQPAALPVSSTRLGVNGMISIKMPKKSRLTAYAQSAR